MASPPSSSTLSPNAIDQHHIRCAICGTEIPYDRWSSKRQSMVCSEACQNKLWEIAVDRYSYRYVSKRAADPRRCVICGALLEGKVRCTKLYCGSRCAKRAWRAGVKADSLMRIRRSAVEGEDGPIKAENREL